jgi:hypothetical protein
MLPARLRGSAATYAAGDTGLMFFLLRMAFWLGLVLILLPSDSGQRPPSSDVHASEAISAASATVQDLRSFCARQPDACTVGSQVAVAIGYKAQAGAKMLYDFLTESLAPRETGSLNRSAGQNGGGVKTSMGKPLIDKTSIDKTSIDKPSIDKTAFDRSATDRRSQNTLTPADLAPVWRGPAPRKDGKHAA